MDGINASIVQTNGINLSRTNFSLVSNYSLLTKFLLEFTTKYPNLYIKNNYFKMILDKLVTKDHFKVVNLLILKSRLNPTLVGFHGQTIYHDSTRKLSFQSGNPQLLSNLLNKQVVSYFRQNDLNHGGQGAPIAPIYHKYLIENLNHKLPVCMINIGGVSNLTYWDGKNLIGFDTGPGNGLMDLYIQRKLKKGYDNKGLIASKGIFSKKTLKLFLNNKFFALSPPKSLDRRQFIHFLKNPDFQVLNHEDAMATLLELTVSSINIAIKKLPIYPTLTIIMGGGAKNDHLIKRLNKTSNYKVLIADTFNLPGEMIEAELIGFLTARFINKLPITFPSTTGIDFPRSGGIIFNPN